MPPCINGAQGVFYEVRKSGIQRRNKYMRDLLLPHLVADYPQALEIIKRHNI